VAYYPVLGSLWNLYVDILGGQFTVVVGVVGLEAYLSIILLVAALICIGEGIVHNRFSKLYVELFLGLILLGGVLEG
jgi:hypothetical protein